MIKLKRNRIKYNNCEIPAKLFYNEIIGKGNLAVLGKGTPKQLQDALMSIIDELCVIEDNKELIAIYRKRDKITRLYQLISYVETSLHVLYYIKLTDAERWERLEKYLSGLPNIKFKVNRKEPVEKEIDRAMSSVVGMLRNQLNSESEDVDKKEQKVKATFEAEVLSLAKITGIRLMDNDSLRYFAELKTLAKRIINEQNKAHGR